MDLVETVVVVVVVPVLADFDGVGDVDLHGKSSTATTGVSDVLIRHHPLRRRLRLLVEVHVADADAVAVNLDVHPRRRFRD